MSEMVSANLEWEAGMDTIDMKSIFQNFGGKTEKSCKTSKFFHTVKSFTASIKLKYYWLLYDIILIGKMYDIIVKML